METPQKLLFRLKQEHTWETLGEVLGFSAPYLHDVANGKKPASVRLLEQLELERVVTYRRRKRNA